MQVELYFDFSCPYAYLGSTQIESAVAASGAELVWRPMLLGGVFRAVDTPQVMSAGMPAPKARHNAWDMARWADHWNVPLSMPAGHPIRTVRALRAVLSLPQPRWPAAIHSLYRAYWVDGERIDDAGVVDRCLERAGVDAPARERAAAANDDPAIKDELRRRTDEAIARGVFGAPTSFVSGDGIDEPIQLWGQDRIHMVRAVLDGWRPGALSAYSLPRPNEAPVDDSPATIDFWYDVSSPFAYLGSTQIEDVADRTGATLRWRPMLLGAIFKHIGTANVPMQAFSPAKTRWYARDLDCWASYWSVPFRFTSRFPMRTVTALRLALLAGDRIAEVSHALFKALWVDDRDISDESELSEILTELGLDATAMLEQTKDPATKQRLIENTTEAIQLGVFGAPTNIVTNESGRYLFWGQDRFDFVEACARGWAPPGKIV